MNAPATRGEVLVDLPPRIVALGDDWLIRASTLEAAMAIFPALDAENFKEADRIAGEAKAFLREIERRREDVKRPVIDLGRAIDGVVKDVVEPLKACVDALGRRILAYEREQKRIAEEKAQRQRDELRAAQEAERKERERAQAKAEIVAAAKGEPPPPAPVVVESVMVPEIVPVQSPRSSSVAARKIVRVRIDDSKLVPIEIGGRLLRPIDEKAVLALLKVGVTVPGCTLVEEESIVSRPLRA